MTHGILVAPQPEAVEAGCMMLMRGGNAIDAAIACAFMQGVVDPLMTGIAGFGSLQVHLPAKRVHKIMEFYGRAPAAARAEMWADRLEGETRDGFGFILRDRINDLGHQSVMVPGNLRAYADAHAAWGALPWREVMAPAIETADTGFIMRPEAHRFMTAREGMGRVEVVDRLRHTATGRAVYFGADGEVHRPGALVRNPDMARSLHRIAEDGVDTFYSGAMAREIDTDMRRHGGLLRYEDLAAYRTRLVEPLRGTYRGYEIATNPPPGGGIMLIQMLNMLEEFDLGALRHNSPAYVRVVAEAMKRATIDKDAKIGDPDFVDVPVGALVDKGYARELAAAIKRGEVARVPRVQAKKEAADTTHLSAIDEHGNAVSMTHTLGMPSGVIPEGLGFMFNGGMGVFDPRPGRPGSIAPGKARFSSMCPSIVFEDGKPRIIIGAPGGTHIAMGVLQAILNMLDHGMSVLEAIAAPRFSATGDSIDVANRIPRFVTNELEKAGYPIVRSPYSYTFAGVHAVHVARDGTWSGAADPGRDGMALAV
jgi:gamma-glutamyltranspeptidase/glutathione hydrolase